MNKIWLEGLLKIHFIGARGWGQRGSVNLEIKLKFFLKTCCQFGGGEGSVPDCHGGNCRIMIRSQNNEECYYQQLPLEGCANIRVKSCLRSFIISISRVWMDHFNIMDEDCLSVHFRAHIVFKLSSLPSSIYLYIIVSQARPDILSQIHHRNKQIFSMWSGDCWEEGGHTFSPCFVWWS